MASITIKTDNKLNKVLLLLQASGAALIKSPVYKTIEDAKNAIRKYLDSSQKMEPRVIAYAVWNGSDWIWEGIV